MKPFKEVSIAIGICERDGQILLIQRKDPNPMWDQKWEFPGGKIESDETPELTAHREVFEETGLRVLNSRFFHRHVYDWELPDETVRVHLHCFHCYVDEGDVVLEADKAYQYAWSAPDRVVEYDNLPANEEIFEHFLSCTHTEPGLR